MRGADATAAGRPGAGAQRRAARTAPAASALADGVASAALAALAAFAALAPPARADLPDHPAIARGPVPAWVAPAGEPRPAPAGASAVAYRLVDDQVLADGDASAVFFQRVLEVVSQPGLQEAAQWEAVFDPGAQRLRVHALEVFRDGAWRDRLASSRASVPLERTPAAEDAAAKDPLEPFYMAIGCAVLGGVPLALVVGVVIAFVVVRRQNRRRAAGAAARAAAAPPAACSRCGAVTPPGTRFCAACGASLGPPAARTGGGGIEPVLTAISVVVGGFMLIGFIGIVAALVIPNFIDALGKARQKRTVADLHAIAAGLDAYYASEGRYPEAATAAELAATLTEAGLLTATPVLDGWKHPLGYTCWPGEPGADGCDDYRLASAGANGEFEHENLADYPGEATERSDFTRDIVRGPEGLIQGPGDG